MASSRAKLAGLTADYHSQVAPRSPSLFQPNFAEADAPVPYGNKIGERIKSIHLALGIIVSPVSDSQGKLGALSVIAGCLFGDVKTAGELANNSQVKLRMMKPPKMTGAGRLEKGANKEEKAIVAAFDQGFDKILAHNDGLPKIATETVTDLLLQVYMVLSKAATSVDAVKDLHDRLWSRRVEAGRSKKENTLHPDLVTSLAALLNKSLAARKLLTRAGIIVRSWGSNGDETAQTIAASVGMMMDIGMTAFTITLRVAMNAELKELDHPKYGTDLVVLTSLVIMQKEMGQEGRFMFLLSHPDALQFMPSRYQSLYSFAFGFTRATVASFANYVPSAKFLDSVCVEEGEKAAKRMSGEDTGDQL